MNTYGLRSVNTNTFNLRPHTPLFFPKKGRDILVTFLRVHNLCLNILGYIPGVSFISGCVRIGIGAITCTVTLLVGDRQASKPGPIIGHWYDEAMLTGITQIARGSLEALVPCGWIANASLDCVFTIWNIKTELGHASTCTGCEDYEDHDPPHPDPSYPFPFWVLKLV
jgi:hypothetical protein